MLFRVEVCKGSVFFSPISARLCYIAIFSGILLIMIIRLYFAELVIVLVFYSIVIFEMIWGGYTLNVNLKSTAGGGKSLNH